MKRDSYFKSIINSKRKGYNENLKEIISYRDNHILKLIDIE